MPAFEYQLARSARRKTLSIVVRRGKVKVMAPASMPRVSIEQFIAEKSLWVQQKLQIQQGWVAQQQQAQKQFVDGETFLYLGNPCVLQINRASKSAVSLINGRIFVELSNRIGNDNLMARVQGLLGDWYKQQMLAYLAHRVEHFAALMRVIYADVKVRCYKSRWGSCSAKGELKFNYLLMMAPDWVIDYVIVHELSHLRHLNHSMVFWAEVKTYCPDYPKAEKWLKDHGSGLRLD